MSTGGATGAGLLGPETEVEIVEEEAKPSPVVEVSVVVRPGK
jgi:hypothetical protein